MSDIFTGYVAGTFATLRLVTFIIFLYKIKDVARAIRIIIKTLCDIPFFIAESIEKFNKVLKRMKK